VIRLEACVEIQEKEWSTNYFVFNICESGPHLVNKAGKTMKIITKPAPISAKPARILARRREYPPKVQIALNRNEYQANGTNINNNGTSWVNHVGM